MPEGKGYGPQSTASTGLELNVIGSHCYAASGAKTDAATGGPNTVLFNFTTGSYYVVGIIDFANNMAANNLTFLELTFNGVPVMAFSNDSESHFAEQPVKLDIIIPPFTVVGLKWGANSSTIGYAFLAGKIHK